MKIKNPETGEIILVPEGMEDAVRDAIESGNDPIEVMQMKYGGIHINPANKGKFNATKKRTGKTTEELTHSKNPLTRKRAIFAQNAKKWKHQDGGQAEQGQQEQMQQLIQIAEQAIAQGASPEEVAQMLIQKGVPEQIVQQVIQYAIQDLQQAQNPQEEMQEQGQEQNPEEEQAEMKYGGIHIKESKKGTFTAAATKHGMGVQEFANKVLANKDKYSPAMVKKANFAHNAAGWHHEYGGMAMYEEGGQLPESLLRTRMKASGATPEEINAYVAKNYNYGGMYADGGKLPKDILLPRLKAHMSTEEANNYLDEYAKGGLIKRADGSYSKKGLWDNIRANKGSGKKPTKQMLEQERKIRANEKAYGGCMECGGKMQNGGKFLRKAQVGTYEDVSIKTPFGNFSRDPRYLESGIIEDKNKGVMYTIKNGKVDKTFPIMTGSNKNGEDVFSMDLEDIKNLEKTNPNLAKKYRVTPRGTYLSTPNPNIYGAAGFNMDPISAFGKAAPKAGNLAQHIIFGLGPKGTEGYDPKEADRRIKIMQGPGEQRVGSYGCTNMYGKDIDCLTGELFPQGDTTIVVDSRSLDDQDFLKNTYGIGQIPNQPTPLKQNEISFIPKDFMSKLNEFSKNNQNVNFPVSFIPIGYNPGLFQNSQNVYNPRISNQAPAQASIPNANQRSSQSTSQSYNQPQISFIPKDFIKNFNEAVQNNQNTSANKPTSQNPTLNNTQKPSKVSVETPRTAQDIRAIQKTLVENGYKLPKSTKLDGSYDGIFGPETKKAFEDFQNKRLVSAQKPGQSKILPPESEYGGGIDNPGFRALPDYVQQNIIDNMAYGGCMECGGKMETGGRFLRKAQFGTFSNNPDESNYGYNERIIPEGQEEQEIQNTMPMQNILNQSQFQPLGNILNPSYNSQTQFGINPFGNFQNPLEQYSFNDAYNPYAPAYGPQINQSTKPFISPLNPRPPQELLTLPTLGLDENRNIQSFEKLQGLQGYNPETSGNLDLNNSMTKIDSIPSTIYNGKQYDTKNNKFNKFNNYVGNLANISGGNSYFGRGLQHLGEATFDFTKGGLELAGTNRSNRNALSDEANNLRTAMRAGYQKVGKRPTDGNAIISKYGGKMMQDGGATYADKMKVSKNSPEADFIAEKGEYIVNNGIASKLETGGSHASGNDTAISLDKSSSPSYVLSDTPRLKQLQFGGKRVSPAKYAEMATVEVLGKTPDQILKGYSSFAKRAGAEGKVFGDKISNATNQLIAQKYQKELATAKQIADQAYHKQEQLKYAMGMDNDLDHAQQVNGIQMSQFGGMQDNVHMNYFNAPAVAYGGSPQLFSDPSGLGYNTTQMAYGGLHKMQYAGNANPYSGWKGQTFSTPSGINTPTGISLNVDPRGDWAGFAQRYSTYDPRITVKQTPEAIGALQEVIYDEYLDSPEGQKALNKMWLDYGVTNKLEKNYSDIATKIKNKENLTEADLKKLRANYIDTFAGKRLPEMLKTPTATTPKPESKESEPPVVESQEVDKKPFEYTPTEEEYTYDIPPVNFYIPQPYGRNPIGLQLAQAQTIRPARLNIQPELNEYTRGMRGGLRGTQGNTSVNVAQQMQGLSNLYNAQNKLFGQKYNFDEQSRMGADQFNAQAIMNTDAANLQRIAAEQDAIARREGILDTQRRTDFQAGLENAQKQNAYNLSKNYIESTFGPYLNNEGKLNFVYNPITENKTNKEKSYTASQLNKMTAEERKALGLKFGGSVKKIKLKLKK